MMMSITCLAMQPLEVEDRPQFLESNRGCEYTSEIVSTGSMRLSAFEVNGIPSVGRLQHLSDNPLETPSLNISYEVVKLKRNNQPISVDSLMPTLQNCIKTKNLAHAKHVHAHICQYGFENDVDMINHIVPMFVACGSALSAQQALNRSAHCNEFSWTALIQGFTEYGDTRHALNLYRNMQSSCVNPSEHTFAALLKGCARQKWVERGQELHNEITKLGIDGDVFLGNSLVGMYAKCGAQLESQNVFDHLSARDVISWNALLTGYCTHGWFEETMDCMDQMELQGISPDFITFRCSLKACSSKGSVEKGCYLHAEVIKKGMEQEEVVCSALVDMYAKCGALLEAHKVFDELAMQGAFEWNALMAGYAEKRLFEEVLYLSQTQRDRILPGSSTYVCSVKVCGFLEAKSRGRELHTELVKRGYENDDCVGSTLVGMYSKCGLLDDAHKVFDQLLIRDLVSWTAIISGYAEFGLGEEALACYEQMQLNHVCPCALLFACALRACCNIRSIGRGRAIHVEIVKQGFEKNSVLGSTMVDMYAKCCSLAEAQHVFDGLPIKDAATWTALIAGYVEHGFGEEALECVDSMEMKGVSPDVVMFASSLKACASMGSLERGRKLHVEVARRGFDTEKFIASALVDMYGKCGFLADAETVFDKLENRDLVSWNAIISGYASHGFSGQALSFFHKMQLDGVVADIVSFNSIIMGFAEQGDSKVAYKVFGLMQEQGLLPNDVIFLSVLKSCGIMSSLQVGKRLHAQLCGVCGELLSNATGLPTILIEMYSNCGSMYEAQKLFDKMTLKHVRMWDALIRGYARQADPGLVSDLLNRMTLERVQPDDILFLNLLNVCTHLGLVEMGLRCFKAMTKVYGITPSIKHHTSMVGLLCRTGQLVEAVLIIERMPVPLSPAVWCSMLDACRKWGNIDVGMWAFERAVSLGHADIALFILMSHLYSEAGMHDAAKNIQDWSLKNLSRGSWGRLDEEGLEACGVLNVLR